MAGLAEYSRCPSVRLGSLAAFLGAFPMPCFSGCCDVPKLIFENNCEKDLTLHGWDMLVKAGKTAEITDSRPENNRISWSYADGSTATPDFIELNQYWSGPGQCFSGHPSYSSYNGFNTASKFEALNPDTGAMACADGGAVVSYQPEDCPTKAGDGYLCAGDRACDSPMGKYIEKHSLAINPDGSWTPYFKDTKYGKNYVNFFCDEIHGFNKLVTTMLHCLEQSVPFNLKVTTCVVDGSATTTTSTTTTTTSTTESSTTTTTRATTSTASSTSTILTSTPAGGTTTVSTSRRQPDDDSDPSSSNAGKVVAITVGVIAAVAAVLGGALCIYRQRGGPRVEAQEGNVALVEGA